MLIQTLLHNTGLTDQKIACDHCSKRAAIQFIAYGGHDLYWCRACALELIRALAVDLGDLDKPVKVFKAKRAKKR
jgi:hypothetical protein